MLTNLLFKLPILLAADEADHGFLTGLFLRIDFIGAVDVELH